MSKFSLQSDNGLFERCFRDNYQALCFYASGILKDDVASEDVVQEVFVRLLNINKDFDSYNHLKHYLYVAVHNLCIDRSKASISSRVSSTVCSARSMASPVFPVS